MEGLILYYIHTYLAASRWSSNLALAGLDVVYYVVFQQSTWSQILRHSCLRQAEVQNQVRRARLLARWTYCMEQSSTPSPPNQ